MKLIFENINGKNYIIKFHEIFMYLENNTMQYIFNIITSGFSKKYLYEFTLDEFKNFIKSCIVLGDNYLTRFEFEAQITQLIETYGHYPDVGTRLILDKKIGNLLLFNHQYFDFPYLKNLEKHFYSVPKTNIITGESGLKQNLEIKYLLIILSNLMYVSVNDYINSEQMSESFENFNLLDFIFDHYD